MNIWRLDIENGCPPADGFDRSVYDRAPCEWNSNGTRRVWKLGAPARCPHDAPAPRHRSLRKYLVSSMESQSPVVLRFGVASSDPRPYSVFRALGRGVGAITAHFDDISGCGEPD